MTLFLRKYIPAIVLVFSWLLVQSQTGANNYAFELGENAEYRIFFGWITLGKAEYLIKDQTEVYEDEKCYRLTIKGHLPRILFFPEVRDEWGSVMRTSDLVPKYTYRYIREGKYKLDEEVYADLEKGNIKVTSLKYHHENPKKPDRYYQFDPKLKMYDMLSGMLLVRNMDLDVLNPGDTVRLHAFFEKGFYEPFKVLYLGTEKIKTKLGKIKSHKLIPLLPKNNFFDGEDSIVCWLSADRNKIPLRITAKMFIAKLGVEIKSLEGTKY